MVKGEESKMNLTEAWDQAFEEIEKNKIIYKHKRSYANRRVRELYQIK